MNLPKLTKLSAWLHNQGNPVSKPTVLRWAHSGEIPAKQMGADWYVMEEGQGDYVAPKLMKLEEWRKARFTTPPGRNTVLAWCQDGVIPTRKINGRWYVKAREELHTTGSDRADAVLKDAA